MESESQNFSQIEIKTEKLNVENWLDLSYLPSLIKIYASVVTRNMKLLTKNIGDGYQRYLLDQPSSFYQKNEGFREGIEDFLGKISELRIDLDKVKAINPNTLIRGNVVSTVKEGKGNCLDWALAIALNYNIQLTQVPGLERTKALIIPYNIESIIRKNHTSIADHFGVCITKEDGQPYVYILYGGSYLYAEELDSILELEPKEQLEKIKKLFSKEECDNEEEIDKKIKMMLISFKLIKRNLMRILEKRKK